MKNIIEKMRSVTIVLMTIITVIVLIDMIIKYVNG